MTTATGRKSVAAVQCPHCLYSYSRAVHGQQTARGFRRRRVCVSCKHGFITYECPARQPKEHHA